MSTNTSIQPASDLRPASPLPQTAPPPPAEEPRVRRTHPAYAVLKTLASLKITVVLFVLSMILVWVGTMVQMDEGIFSAMHNYFRCFIIWVPFRVFVRFGQVFFGLPAGLDVKGGFPFFGGWTLGTALMINLLAAHIIRFKLSWKRAGIITLHVGLIVMMLGELYTGLFAVEGRMTIIEGKSANFLELPDYFEFVAIHPRNETTENVVVVPGSRLRQGQTLSDPQLPFDVRVDRFMPNSTLKARKRSSVGAYLQQYANVDRSAIVRELPDNPADSGLGKEAVAVAKPAGTGVDAESRHDFPSAYLTFLDKKTGQALGTYLVSAWLTDLPAQKVTVDGATYQIDLRFQRIYKPYTVHALKVTAEFYPGTTIPRDYSSVVRFVDPSREVDRETRIYMNQPLRYQGEAFFQIGMQGKTTVLQVTRNKGWLLPYISCIVVGLGMLLHFIPKLNTFLDRRLGA
jgi:hypothetical protein